MTCFCPQGQMRSALFSQSFLYNYIEVSAKIQYFEEELARIEKYKMIF